MITLIVRKTFYTLMNQLLQSPPRAIYFLFYLDSDDFKMYVSYILSKPHISLTIHNYSARNLFCPNYLRE